MTKSNNNNGQQNQQQQSIDFINEKWAFEEKCFTDTLMPPVKVQDRETKRSRWIRKPWPRVKPIEQRGYELFYSKVIDPATGKAYEQRDSSGNVIKQTDGLGPLRHIVSTIVRLKSVDGNEYLYTLGQLHGFNSFGDHISYYVHKPEIYNKTFFDSQRRYDQREQRIIEVVTSPISQQEVYTIPFSAENVDILFATKTIKQNTPQIYRGGGRNRRAAIGGYRPVNFVVKDEQSDSAIAVEWSSTEKTLELFRNKSFEYLYNTEYIPEPLKAELRSRSEGITGEKIKESPKISDNSSSSSSSSAIV